MLKNKGLLYVINRVRMYTCRLFWINDIRILKMMNERLLQDYFCLKYKKKIKKAHSELLQTKHECYSSNERLIFSLWLQGEENAPDLVKRCFSQIRSIYGNRLVVLNEKTISQYATIPSFILEKFRKGIIGFAHYSDIVRTSVLLEHGGVWMDSTCYLISPIPDSIMNSSFFVFKMPKCYPGGVICSNWFIVANKQERILKILSQMLFEYWKYNNVLLDYLQYHLFLSTIVKCIGNKESDWIQMPYFNNDTPHILGREMLNNYNKNRYEELLKFSFVHKLSNHYKSVPQNSYLDIIING